MQIPQNLLEKYNIPVPRYTSYPPANFFGDIDGETYLALIKDSNNSVDSNVSIYIHIPFCKQLCFYCGCNMSIYKDEDLIKKYFDALQKEIEVILPLIDNKRKLSQIHYGGGTPNAVSIDYIKKINEIFFDYFENTKSLRISQKQKVQGRKIFVKGAYETVSDGTINFSDEEIGSFSEDSLEVAIECHPAHLDEQYIEGLIEAGFNRISLGIQDINLEVLQNINRKPSKLDLDKLFSILKSKGLSINLDFIYGLPGQTSESFSETIKKAIELKPNRIVTFSYAHVPSIKPHQKALEAKGLPTASEKALMFQESRDLLLNSGYKSIGMDHYVLPQDDLYVALENHNLHRNFQGYCTRETTGQVYAFGVSAISQFESSYIQNTKSLEKYIDLLSSGKLAPEKGLILIKNHIIIKEMIDVLMCNYYLDLNEICKKFGININELNEIAGIKKDSFDEMVADGLITFEGGIISVSETGKFFIRNIASKLDPYFAGAGKVFSKAV